MASQIHVHVHVGGEVFSGGDLCTGAAAAAAADDDDLNNDSDDNGDDDDEEDTNALLDTVRNVAWELPIWDCGD